MSLRSLSVIVVLAVACATTAVAAPLRFCADPDNLPFSNRAMQGLDNRVATVVAREVHRRAEFVWVRNGRGFLRETFNRDACDVLMGVPEKMRGVLTTKPYYRSAYVFVTRREGFAIASFSDPHLNGRKIGLQVLEDNLSPPSLALIRTGHAAQMVGFNSFGPDGAKIVRSVAGGQIGAAIVWGPLAGYFTRLHHLPLEITPVSPLVDASGVPFAFSICMAVHQRDAKLRDLLNQALIKLSPSIIRILTEYNVPTIPEERR